MPASIISFLSFTGECRPKGTIASPSRRSPTRAPRKSLSGMRWAVLPSPVSPASSLPSTDVPELCRSPSPSSSITPSPSTAPVSIKIADLGNATPIDHHYTEDIQTRQYRAPEAITGRTDWGATADIWSLACVVFELLTAEYLFDPQSQGELFGKDDDHCAQIIELIGKWPESVLWGGRYSREIFDSNGECFFADFPGLIVLLLALCRWALVPAPLA